MVQAVKAKAAKGETNEVNQQAVETSSREHVVEVKNLYTTKAAIEKAIVSVNQSTKKAMVEIQLIACSILAHLYEHKDITVVRNLLDNFPSGFRKQAISGFIDAYAPVKFEMDTETKKTMVHFNKERFAKDFDTTEKRHTKLEQACGNAWYNMNQTREAEYRPFDIHETLKRTLAMAKTRFEKGIHPELGDNLSADAILQLEALVNKTKPIVNALAKPAPATSEPEQQAA